MICGWQNVFCGGCIYEVTKMISIRRNRTTDVVLRTDGGARIGTGHVMRCLALAQAIKDAGGNAVFVMTMDAPALEVRLKEEGMEVIRLKVLPGSYEDAIQTAGLAKKTGERWVVVDGYHFGAEFQKILKESGLRLLCIDDSGHAKHYYADIVLNQNIHANRDFYDNREPYTRLLLGSRYVMLRKEFIAWRSWQREIPEVARRVLVSMGGGDPHNHTLKVIQTLEKVHIPEQEVTVVVGASNSHADVLEAAIKQSSIPINLVHNPTNMAELMAWAGVLVSTAGSTVWEAAFMGAPSVVGISAPVEELMTDALKKHGLFFCTGWLSRLSVDQLTTILNRIMHDKSVRRKMCISGKHLVDGMGCQRVLKDLLSQ